jgi:hypothetical protein
MNAKRMVMALTVAFGVATLVSACGIEGTEEVPGAASQAPVAGDAKALLGAVTYASDCKAEWKPFLDKATRFGRVAATSTAFTQCVSKAVKVGYPGTGPLRSCAGNPFDDWSQDEQISMVIAAARNTDDVSMSCPGGSGGNAWANFGPYGHTTAEKFWWAGWLKNVNDWIATAPVCTAPGVPKDCKTAADVEGLTIQAAGIVWHEAMHTHGYTHGANDQSNAVVACGQPYAVRYDMGYQTVRTGWLGGTISVPVVTSTNESTTGWHFQVNTMPYILGNCIDETLRRSVAQCGAIETCGAGLNLVTNFDGAACACVRDPHQPAVRWRRLGTAQVRVTTDPWPRPAKTITACQDGRLYMLSNENTIYVNKSGGADGAWKRVAYAWKGRGLACADNRLYQFDSDRKLYRNDGSDAAPKWTYVGRPGGAKQITGATGFMFLGTFGMLYALNDDNSLWQSPSGADGTWKRVGQPGGAGRIAAGGSFMEAARVFALNGDRSLWLNSGDGCDAYWHWFTNVGDTVDIAARNTTTIYALNSDSSLWEGTITGSDYLTTMAFGHPRHCDGTKLVE